MEKAYSYRFYPTPEQESLLRRTLGCVRLVYNKALHLRTQAWYEKQERVGYAETSSMLTEWKKQENSITMSPNVPISKANIYILIENITNYFSSSNTITAKNNHNT